MQFHFILYSYTFLNVSINIIVLPSLYQCYKYIFVRAEQDCHCQKEGLQEFHLNNVDLL